MHTGRALFCVVVVIYWLILFANEATLKNTFKWKIKNVHILWGKLYTLFLFIKEVCMCRSVTRCNFFLYKAISISNDLISHVLWWYLIHDIYICFKKHVNLCLRLGVLLMTFLLLVVQGREVCGRHSWYAETNGIQFIPRNMNTIQILVYFAVFKYRMILSMSLRGNYYHWGNVTWNSLINCGARSRYQGQGQVITSHSICEM